MNNSNNKWKFSAIALSMLVIASCGMTPAEKKAQREVIAKQQKLQNEAKAKNSYSAFNDNFVWRKNTKIPSQNKQFNYERFGKKYIEFNDDFLWEKGGRSRLWPDAMANCQNSKVAGLTNWRLPSVDEARKLNWSLKDTDYNSGHSYWTSIRVSDLGTSPLPGSTRGWRKYEEGKEYAYQWYISERKAKGVILIGKLNDRYHLGITRCIHDRNASFRDFSLYETAQAIFKLKKPSEQKLTTIFPKSIEHKLKTFTPPEKGEFESTKKYQTRINKLRNNINAHNEKLKADYDKAYQRAVAKQKQEYALIKNKFERQEAQHKVDSFKEAFFVMYGDPKLKNINYNADQQAFTMNVTSQYGSFNQQLRIPLSVKYAPKFKKLITAKSFSPTVELDIRNGEIFVTGIKEIADPTLIVERDEFNKAKKSIKKLNTFISKYPKSKYVAKAKAQIKKLQRIAEEKRLAAVELAKDNADGKIVGTKNLEGAKFIAGRIWQDQPFNSKPKALNYKQAKEYCGELTLLGTNGWRLPSKNDFEKLGKDMNMLSYRAFRTHYFSDYFTRDDNCTYRGLANVSKQNCVIGVDISKNSTPYVSTADKRNSNSVRCVLSTYKYNKYAKEQERKFLNENSLDGYINAFMAVGDDANIRKAFNLAKNNNDLAKVETALIKYFGLHDVFSLKGSLITKKGEDANRGEIDASLLLNMIASSGNAEFKYEVFPNINSTVPLKYGKYKVRLKIKLELAYQTTMKKALFGFDLSTGDTQVKEREFDVILSPENDWKASGNVDFGTIMQGSKAGALVFKFETKLGSIKPSFDLLSIERLE